MQPSEASLWQELQDAIALPAVANLARLLDLLDWAIAQVPEQQQLAIAGRAIEQMADIHALRFNLLMQLWEDAEQPLEDALPVLDFEDWEAWIRQSMSVDLDTLVEQPRRKAAQLPIRSPTQQTHDSTDSVVAIVEPTILLQLVEQMQAQPEPEQIIWQLAGEEDPVAWAGTIAQWLQRYSYAQPVRFTDIRRELSLSWVEVWLGLLLGGFELEQIGEFYTGDIAIHIPNPMG